MRPPIQFMRWHSVVRATIKALAGGIPVVAACSSAPDQPLPPSVTSSTSSSSGEVSTSGGVCSAPTFIVHLAKCVGDAGMRDGSSDAGDAGSAPDAGDARSCVDDVVTACKIGCEVGPDPSATCQIFSELGAEFVLQCGRKMPCAG